LLVVPLSLISFNFRTHISHLFMYLSRHFFNIPFNMVENILGDRVTLLEAAW